jgi:hypothetical protein
MPVAPPAPVVVVPPPPVVVVPPPPVVVEPPPPVVVEPPSPADAPPGPISPPAPLSPWIELLLPHATRPTESAKTVSGMKAAVRIRAQDERANLPGPFIAMSPSCQWIE